MTEILCCGEALIDMIPRQTSEGDNCFVPHVGGSVYNTAVALGRLGNDVSFVSGISSDFFGDLLRHKLTESGVNTQCCVVADLPTTLAFVQLVDGEANYAFYDENTAGRMLTADAVPTLPQSSKALFFGGISLVSEPGGSAYQAIAEQESSQRVIMIDPNIRPQFISDEQQFRSRMETLFRLADIAKVSVEDLNWLCPDRNEQRNFIRDLLAGGIKLLLVTAGADGATAYTRNETVHVSAVETEVVDTVGAGDTFNAGVLAKFSAFGLLDKGALAALDREHIASAMEFASKIASVNASRSGSNPPWRSELLDGSA